MATESNYTTKKKNTMIEGMLSHPSTRRTKKKDTRSLADDSSEKFSAAREATRVSQISVEEISI